MTFQSTLLLVQTWLAHPVRACIGLLGVGLLVGSILPLFGRSKAHSPLRFAGDIGQLWRRSGSRAIVGVLGVILFFWSILPVATMK